MLYIPITNLLASRNGLFTILSPSVQCLENNVVEGVWSQEDQGPLRNGILLKETGEEINHSTTVMVKMPGMQQRQRLLKFMSFLLLKENIPQSHMVMFFLP